MKVGLSTYSLAKAIQAGTLDLPGAVSWIARNGGEHAEIVPVGLQLTENESLADQLRECAAKEGIELSNYAISANFMIQDEKAYRAEIDRVIREVEIARRLGVCNMRHDVGPFVPPETGRNEQALDIFRRELPRIANACREIADYAAMYGITTSLENHGKFINGHEIVKMVVDAVGRPNFAVTLDVGNFWCVDADPVTAVSHLIDKTSFVHLKDFYYRDERKLPKAVLAYKARAGGWFQTLGGNILRGAVTGDGDIDLTEILRLIRSSGYDGYLSIEFEGIEDCLAASAASMANVRFLLENI
jgi:sugar phosphate isomerase/epimerase